MMSSNNNSLLQTALAECAGGATAGAIADFVLYGVDSAKVRKQTTPSKASAGSNVSILFRGLIPTIAFGSVPVFGSFFFIYAPIRDILIDTYGQNTTMVLPLASAICAIPATIIGVPADVIKKHLVLGIDTNVQSAISSVVRTHGYQGLFAGWHVNLIRDLPFAGVKIGLYEWFIGIYKNQFMYKNHNNNDNNNGRVPTCAVAGCGIASGVCCAVLTCPLDVVNTRIKADRAPSTHIMKVATQILKEEGPKALFRGVILRSAVLGVGSSIFWPIQRHVSHYLNPTVGGNFRGNELDRLTEF